MSSPPGDAPQAAEGPGEPNLHLSIDIPVFDERENLTPLWAELHPVLREASPSHEVIFVDDGSTDGSAEVIKQLRAASSCIRVLRARRNSGQSAALLAGFRAARGEIVVSLDGDGQNDPTDIPALLRHLPEYDAAVGYRKHRADGPVRRLTSLIGNAVRNLVSGDDIIDTGCTLKAFRKECLKELPAFNGMHRFLPTLIRMAGFRVRQVPVAHRPRLSGRSKYGIGNRLLPVIGDLLAVRWMKSRRLPLTDIEEI